ncbi:hypothetical protein [Streptomyces sp. NPDC093089]|uniref:hypothetical protein n=1 Tax=Streptomyces sp. NPDC093089 TaxID=3366024 RepID=UPI00382309FC
MQYVVAGALLALSLAVAISGVVELVTGWIHPWERARVLRPVPHGIGQVLVGSGLCCLLGVLAFAPSGSVLATLVAVGGGLFLAGTVLVGVSRFPDR